MRAAVIQLNSQDDKQANVATAMDLIGQAADAGADLIALPETLPFCGPLDQQAAHAETIPGPTIDSIADVARQRRVHVLAGSIHERVEGEAKLFNTTVLIGPEGAILATYRKIHLFDVKGLDNESRTVQAGGDIVVVDTSLGRIGLSICYDLRFPELYRRLSAGGAQIICAPSAFTLHTGRDHWEVLLRARAIENLAYVIAPNQFGPHPPDKRCFGHSMIVDPWGTVIAQVPDGVGYAVADIDPERLARVRKDLPALDHRRLDDI